MTPPVAVVTGASRGAGRGIARALGDLGATVYLTGRSASVADVAGEVDARGGHGVGVVCDHRDGAAVAALFHRVGEEQGRLDVLVNNAIALPSGLGDDQPFWERPLEHQGMFDVGLRSTYAASWHAARLLIAARGLLVNTSSFGGGCYMHGPAYGAAKAGVDRLAHDFGIDLAPHGVTAVSLWMGILRTERTLAALEADPDKYGDLAARTESVELPGRVIAALWQRPDRARWNGQVVVNAELAVELGVTDVDGGQPPSHRSMLGGPPAVNPAIVR